jgi:hypothetical protein
VRCQGCGGYDSDWKIVGTSLGFSVFSASAATGGSLRLRSASYSAVCACASSPSTLPAEIGGELWLAAIMDV